MKTIAEILADRGVVNPIGQKFGRGLNFKGHEIAEVVKVTEDGQFVLKIVSTRPDRRPGRGNHSVVTGRGRITIRPDNDSEVFN